MHAVIGQFQAWHTLRARIPVQPDNCDSGKLQMKQTAGIRERKIQDMPHRRGRRPAVAEQRNCFLPVIRPAAAVVSAVPLIAEGTEPFICHLCHIIRFRCDFVVPETGQFPPAGIIQVISAACQQICQIPGMAVTGNRCSVNASPVQFPHIIQRGHRKLQYLRCRCRRFSCPAQGRSINGFNSFRPETLCRSLRLESALFCQAVTGIIRFPMAYKDNPHVSFRSFVRSFRSYTIQ